MKTAFINTMGNQTFLDFFNSKEVYQVKGFDTERKARNYAKKWGYEVYETLPEGVGDYRSCD